MKDKGELNIESILQRHVAPCKYGITSSDISLAAREIIAYIEGLMPTDEEIEKRIKDKKEYTRQFGYNPQVMAKYGDAYIDAIDWLRSRLTKDGAKDSQKTEGGE